jgi:hypothetical protein
MEDMIRVEQVPIIITEKAIKLRKGRRFPFITPSEPAVLQMDF